MSNNVTQRIKKPQDDRPLTEEQAEEWAKCADDKEYWMTNYARVDGSGGQLEPFNPRPYQKRIIDIMNKNRFSIFLSGRQTGKCCRSDTKVVCRVPLKFVNNTIEFTISMSDLHEYVKQIKNGDITNAKQEEHFIKSSASGVRYMSRTSSKDNEKQKK